MGHQHPLAAQPVTARNGTLVLIAHGEIHNHLELRQTLEEIGHRFTTADQAEALLHAYLAYGLDFLRRLRGTFAFALYDREKKRLLLARDRLGVQPLYIARLPGGIAFASEFKALLALFQNEPRVDPKGLAEYLQNGFASGRTTLLAGVERLLPAEAVCIEQGQVVKRWRYWSALNVKPANMDYAEAEERFNQLMDSVIREQLPADRPFGVFLTGGAASAVLLALLKRHTEKPMRTFGTGESARSIAQRFGCRHAEINPGGEEMLFNLPYAIWASGELTLEPSGLPHALASSAVAGVNLVLSSAGSGAIFGGYDHRRTSLRRLKAMFLPTRRFSERRMFRGRQRTRLFGPVLKAISGRTRRPFIAAWHSSPSAWSYLQRMQYVDLATTLPHNLLPQLEGTLTAWGLNGRFPFLDHRVVEFGLAFPDALKASGSRGEGFLGRWARVNIDQNLQNPAARPGREGEEFSTLLRARLSDVLPNLPAIRQWFRPEGVAALLRETSTERSVRMIRSLLRFAIWHQLFIEGGGEPPPQHVDPVRFLLD